MEATKLVAMWNRKQAGEKVADLAAELGVSRQELTAAWKRAGFYAMTGDPAAEPVQVAEPVAAATTQDPEPEPTPLADPEPSTQQPVVEADLTAQEDAVSEQATLDAAVAAMGDAVADVPDPAVAAAQAMAEKAAAEVLGKMEAAAAAKKGKKDLPPLPPEDVLKALFGRHQGGEKIGALAKEAGCSWNRLWVVFDEMKKAAK